VVKKKQRKFLLGVPSNPAAVCLACRNYLQVTPPSFDYSSFDRPRICLSSSQDTESSSLQISLRPAQFMRKSSLRAAYALPRAQRDRNSGVESAFIKGDRVPYRAAGEEQVPQVK
jgi:hypothetical protein